MSAAATPLRPTAAPLRTRLLPAYVMTLALGAVVAAYLGGAAAVAAQPLLFVILAASLLALNAVEDDLFGGGHQTPTTVPSLALALVFGPFGAVAGEALITAHRALQRKPPIKVTFDFGALALSGVAAWAVAEPLWHQGSGVLVTGLVAGAAYYVTNNGLLMVVWMLHEGRSPVSLWRERLASGMPHELAYGPVTALLVLAEAKLGLVALALVAAPVATIWLGQSQVLSADRRRIDELSTANARLRRLMVTTVESLARTIEARDPYTGGHTERVGLLARAIAEHLGLPDEDLRALDVGAVIHDIGKIGIPDAVLLKAGPLDDDEWELMRRHPSIGAYILDELDIPATAKAMARHHHERYDGTGYPDGLAGEGIPLAARVLSVADALDAMTSDRPYRKALPMEAALAEIRDKAGTQFCPRVVQAAVAAVTSGGTP